MDIPSAPPRKPSLTVITLKGLDLEVNGVEVPFKLATSVIGVVAHWTLVLVGLAMIPDPT